MNIFHRGWRKRSKCGNRGNTSGQGHSKDSNRKKFLQSIPPFVVTDLHSNTSIYRFEIFFAKP
jgi:hypothetical protein